DLSRLPRACPRVAAAPRAVLTAAVCTRNHASQLPECLNAIAALDYPPHLLDVLIVDNAPEDDSTRDVAARYASFRYVREPRPGLDWARNRAILECRGEIVAYTDDDVSVDAGWARAIAAAFEEEPHAMCVTGLVVPDEIDTVAQRLFEVYGGFNRGFSRWVYRVDVDAGEHAARSARQQWHRLLCVSCQDCPGLSRPARRHSTPGPLVDVVVERASAPAIIRRSFRSPARSHRRRVDRRIQRSAPLPEVASPCG